MRVSLVCPSCCIPYVYWTEDGYKTSPHAQGGSALCMAMQGQIDRAEHTIAGLQKVAIDTILNKLCDVWAMS